MTRTELRTLFGFFENELTNQVLSFWLPRCEDREFGGYVNCFDNRGEHLVSYDKYTWSQGRFVWLFSKLFMTTAPIFSQTQRTEFLRLAKQGADFLMAHCLMGPEDWRCVFLMERDGSPKHVEGWEPLDMSIYADCFAVVGLGKYAHASGDRAAYRFAKRLHESCVDRVRRGEFHTLPYPLSSAYRAHGIPMILSNTTKELYLAAKELDSAACPALREQVRAFCEDILTHFVDGENVMHEVITRDNAFIPQLLGQHMNPGHTIEDGWFLLEGADLCGCPQWKRKIYPVVEKAFQNGWDREFGGLLHFCGVSGGKPEGDLTGVEEEPMVKQLSGWGDKLWWIHSEALYTTLLCYFRGGGQKFRDMFERVFTYTVETFPNRDQDIREWVQIRTRDGKTQEKVVALPVKDPFHIARNLILILELLDWQLTGAELPGKHNF